MHGPWIGHMSLVVSTLYLLWNRKLFNLVGLSNSEGTSFAQRDRIVWCMGGCSCTTCHTKNMQKKGEKKRRIITQWQSQKTKMQAFFFSAISQGIHSLQNCRLLLIRPLQPFHHRAPQPLRRARDPQLEEARENMCPSLQLRVLVVETMP